MTCEGTAYKMKFLIFLLVVTSVFDGIYADHSNSRRPIYSIGHMVNSIEGVSQFLDSGANALELDIMFNSDGTVHQVHHGFPCDCNRDCTEKSDLSEYLQHVRSITRPGTGKYSGQLTLLYFDLKLLNVLDKYTAGSEVARYIITDLWGSPNSSSEENLQKVIVSINYVSSRDVVAGFKDEFKRRNTEKLLKKNIGLDGGVSNLKDISQMWEDMAIRNNIWQGDGISNCFSDFSSDRRLREALKIRDFNHSFFAIDKVYHWTIDSKRRLRTSLNLGADGIITNVPTNLMEVMEEDTFKDSVRMASVKDNPFERFNPED